MKNICHIFLNEQELHFPLLEFYVAFFIDKFTLVLELETIGENKLKFLIENTFD